MSVSGQLDARRKRDFPFISFFELYSRKNFHILRYMGRNVYKQNVLIQKSYQEFRLRLCSFHEFLSYLSMRI